MHREYMLAFVVIMLFSISVVKICWVLCCRWLMMEFCTLKCMSYWAVYSLKRAILVLRLGLPLFAPRSSSKLLVPKLFSVCFCFAFIIFQKKKNYYSYFSFWIVVCDFVGEKGRRIRELTTLIQKRFNFPENSVQLYAEKVSNRGLCAAAQAESLRYKLLGGLAVRRYIGLLC